MENSRKKKMTKQDVDRLIDEDGLRLAAAQCRVAAILFTYRCSISCRHCLFGCAGDQPDVVMTPRQCADGLAMLHETGRVVHIAGGEAMLYWEALSASIYLAHAEGSAPHFIETNCSFATDDALVRHRFGFLADHDVKGLLASVDPYHQEFVPPERFLRVRRIAREIFGEQNFYGPGEDDAEIEELRTIARDEKRLRDHVRRHPPVMVGTARKRLAQYLDRYAADAADLPQKRWQGDMQGPACLGEFQADSMWEFHIDPYDNIQTNCGIILGKVPEVHPAELLATGPEKANRFVQTVAEKGALGLAELARREHGFEIPEQVTQNCELCYLTRHFLRQYHPDLFGPAEVYS